MTVSIYPGLIKIYVNKLDYENLKIIQEMRFTSEFLARSNCIKWVDLQ